LPPICGRFSCQGCSDSIEARQVARNSLFVGSERGGKTAAILSSLTSTCRRQDIDPQRYLTQLLTNLPATPISQLDQWLPNRWKQMNRSRLGEVRLE
jgi:hypothetical protein